MAKSILTPWTHTAKTAREITTTICGNSVTVPAGTRCHKLDGGSDPWVVADIGFIDPLKDGLLRHDADYRGIRIAEADLVNIQPSSYP